MKVLAVLSICAVLSWAEPPADTPAAVEYSYLQVLADELTQAIRNHDLPTAAGRSGEISARVLRLQNRIRLAQLESGLRGDGEARFHSLTDLPNAACDALEYDKAEQYANELLALAAEHKDDSNYGNAIFYGNMALGRVALARDRNVAKAKAALLASGQTPGSPTLSSFGPSMVLAKELLEAGESDAVLQYFHQCRAFWKSQRKQLDDWSAVVKRCCRLPDFGANLSY